MADSEWLMAIADRLLFALLGFWNLGFGILSLSHCLIVHCSLMLIEKFSKHTNHVIYLLFIQPGYTPTKNVSVITFVRHRQIANHARFNVTIPRLLEDVAREQCARLNFSIFQIRRDRSSIKGDAVSQRQRAGEP